MPPKKKGISEPEVIVPNGDAAAGRAIFDANCSACHSIEPIDVKTASAPVLGGVYGRLAGQTEFKYSSAVKKSGITWN